MPPDGTPAADRRLPLADAGILLLCFLLNLTAAARLPLFDPDEPYYAEGGREMLLRHDWITPHFNGLPHLNKPALFYWLVAISMRLFGTNELAARLPSILLGVAWVCITMAFARRFLGPAAGWMSGLALGTCLNTLVLAHAAVTDVTLSLFITGAIFSFYLADAAEEGAMRLRWLVAAYGCVAAAMLAKGFIGAVMPVLVLSAYELWRRDWLGWVRRVRPGLGAAVVLPLWGTWFGLAWRANGASFLRVMVLNEQIRRFRGGLAEHPGPFWYYVPVVAVLFFPWSALLPAAAAGAWRRATGRPIAGAAPADTSPVGHKPPGIRPHEPVVFVALWALVVLAFFSLSRVKLHFYVATAYPAMAILVGMLWTESWESGRAARRAWPVLLALGLALAAAALVAPHLLRHSPFARGGLQSADTAALAALADAGAVGGSVALARGRRAAAAVWLAALAVGLNLVVLLGLVPALASGREDALRSLSRAGRQAAGRSQPMATCDVSSNLPVFYAGPPVFEAQDPGALAAMSRSARPRVVLTRFRDVPLLEHSLRARLLAHQGQYALVELGRWTGPSPAGWHGGRP